MSSPMDEIKAWAEAFEAQDLGPGKLPKHEPITLEKIEKIVADRCQKLDPREVPLDVDEAYVYIIQPELVLELVRDLISAKNCLQFIASPDPTMDGLELLWKKHAAIKCLESIREDRWPPNSL